VTWIKLCGLTRRSDVEAAVAAGADAVGFVIAPESTRRVTVEEAAALGAGLEVSRVLVTVDLGPDALLAAAAAAGVDGVQPHGRFRTESASSALAAGYLVLFPVRVDAAVSLAGMPEGATPILDAAVPGRHGGTGTIFDWSAAEGLDVDYVLAGGLDPGNIADALRRLRPWGVDVSSGIEARPGVKDHDLMRRFVEAVRWS
jgi:phosphoribosylanthranilate isomerase